MTTSSWDLVDLDSYYYWLEPLFDALYDFRAAEKKSATKPMDMRKGCYAFFCLFETPTGTALGLKLTGQAKPNYYDERSITNFVNVSNTVVTWNIKKLETGDLSILISSKADYFLPINRENVPIFEEICAAFEKGSDSKDFSETLETPAGEELERSVHIGPSISLNRDIKDKWKGLKKRSIIKATSKNKESGTVKETYFISSLPFSLSDIEELTTRAIWQYWNVKDLLEEVIVIDCHFDKGAGKNATYIDNCEYLKTFSNRIKPTLSNKLTKYFDKLKYKPIKYDRRKLICDLLEDISAYYQNEKEEQDYREYYEELGYEFPDDWEY